LLAARKREEDMIRKRTLGVLAKSGLLVLALLTAGVMAVWAASVTPQVIPGSSNTDKTCAVVYADTTISEVKFEDATLYDGSVLWIHHP
jgi:hypothetical protein